MAENDEDDLETDDELDLKEPDLDEATSDEDLEEDLDGAADNDEGADVLEEELEIVDLDAAAGTVAEPRAKPAADEEKADEDDVVLELDEEQHPDDVEEPLDVLLQEKTAAATLEDDEEEVEEEEVETDERGEAPAKIVPRRPGEFLCTSCFLVLPRNQLADEKRMLCRDCA